MNKERLKKISDIAELLDNAKSSIEALRDEINDLQEIEQDILDNYPENMQDGARYERTDRANDALLEAVEGVDNIVDSLDDLIGTLQGIE